MSFCLISSIALADVYGRLGLFYTSEESGTKELSKQSRMLIDAGGGYVSAKGWALGGLYGMETLSNQSASSSRVSMGPSVGWISTKDSGPYAFLTYFFSTKISTYSGSGYQGDLGYKLGLKGAFALTIQFSYKHFSYDQRSSVALTNPYVQNLIDPYVGVMMQF